MATTTTTTTTTTTATVSDFIGTWELESFEIRRSDESVLFPLGPDPVGRITYDTEGRMAVQVMRPDRPAFASGDMLDGTPDEIAQGWAGFIAYAGSFDVDPKAGTVTHRIEISSFPNWVGEGQVRFFAFEGDALELTTAPLAYGGVSTVAALVWRRDG